MRATTTSDRRVVPRHPAARRALRLTADYTEPIPFLGESSPGSRGPARTEKDLAQGRPVTASSVQTGETTSRRTPWTATTSTRWSSAVSDPQWIAVDLGSVTPISHVVLNWETAYAHGLPASRSASTARPGRTFTSTTEGAGGAEDIKFAPTPGALRADVRHEAGDAVRLLAVQLRGLQVTADTITASNGAFWKAAARASPGAMPVWVSMATGCGSRLARLTTHGGASGFGVCRGWREAR